MELNGPLRHIYPGLAGDGREAGIRAGDLLYISGLTPRLRAGSSLDAVREQAHEVLRQARELIEAQGGSLDNLGRVTGYVNDAGLQREAVYEAWDAVFPNPDDKPAFKILDAPLPGGVLFQMDLLALLGHRRTRIDIPNVDARDPCVRIGDWVLSSRLHGTSPDSGATVPGGLEPETRQALSNGIRLVELAGGTRSDITQVVGFGVDLTYVDKVREIINEAFDGDPLRPAFIPIQTFVRPVLAVMLEVTAVIGGEARPSGSLQSPARALTESLDSSTHRAPAAR